MAKVPKKRKAIPPSVRFEVFKRDCFKCQYCGRCAPEIILHVDHISPVSKGGASDILNLITSCVDCNLGKGARTLDDASAVNKQRSQLAELEERRAQLDMMLQWRSGQVDLAEHAVAGLCKLFEKLCPGFSLNDVGRATLRNLVSKFGAARAGEGMQTAAARSLRYKNGKPTGESIEIFLRTSFIECEPPDVKALYRLRNEICNRWNYANRGQCISMLRRALERGIGIDRINEFTRDCMIESPSSFKWWTSEFAAFIENEGNDGTGKD